MQFFENTIHKKDAIFIYADILNSIAFIIYPYFFLVHYNYKSQILRIRL